jgi:uncharacterized membrane protein YdbT with pleckstrin-like domain
MDLHSDEEVIYQGHPSWRSTFALYLKGVLAAVVVGAIAALVTRISGGEVDWAWVLVLFAAAVGATILVGFVHRLFTVFTITNQRLRIQRGIIARNVQQTRIERVQNVNTEQGVIDRVLRVGSVDFDTAGTTDADFRFDGVNNPEEVVVAVDKAQREHTLLAQRQGLPTDGLG